MNAEIGTLMATVGAVVVTAIATRISYTVAKRQSSPEVIVYTEHDSLRASIITLVIKNIGNSPAHNIRFYPSERVPDRAFGFHPLSDEKKISRVHVDGPLVDGVPFLPPGGTRVIDWGQFGGLSFFLKDRAIKIRAEYYEGRKDFRLPSYGRRNRLSTLSLTKAPMLAI